jgi:hypothetical protein
MGAINQLTNPSRAPTNAPTNPLFDQQWQGPGSDTKNAWLFKADNTKCIELQGGSTTNGNSIIINECNNAKQQQWAYNPLESGWGSCVMFTAFLFLLSTLLFSKATSDI